MPRPSVLIVEPNSHRRHELGNGLASEGYEVVPASGAEEGLRFAQSLGPAVIIAPASLTQFGEASVLAELTRHSGGMGRTVVLLGDNGVPAPTTMPRGVVLLPVDDLDPGALMRRLQLLLIGRELGLSTDGRLETLVGDLSDRPLLELLRGLQATRIHGRVELEGGVLEIDQGEVVGASAGRADGLKAFCRLARLGEAEFRLVVTEQAPSEMSQTDKRRIEVDFKSLVTAAIHDSMGEFPDPLSRLELSGQGHGTDPSALQQQILQAARQGVTVQEVLDALDVADGQIVQAILELERQGSLVRREPVTLVRVLTDSTSDLPTELARSHGIAVLPLKLRFGKTVYRDRVDLLPRDFYRILEQKVAEPETEPLTPEEIVEVYGQVTPKGDVLALHVSSRLAETLERVGKATASQPREHRLEIIDSSQISLGLGLQALFAARMAIRGFDLDTILQRLEAIRPRLVSYTVLDTLDYLVQGQRVGKAKALLQGLLDIKPILTLDQGDIVLVDKARGQRAVQPRLLELLATRLDTDRPTVLGITHANAAGPAERLGAALEERYPLVERIVTEAGPVIGAHVGPGTLGVVAFQPSDEELPWLQPLDASPG